MNGSLAVSGKLRKKRSGAGMRRVCLLLDVATATVATAIIGVGIFGAAKLVVLIWG